MSFREEIPPPPPPPLNTKSPVERAPAVPCPLELARGWVRSTAPFDEAGQIPLESTWGRLSPYRFAWRRLVQRPTLRTFGPDRTRCFGFSPADDGIQNDVAVSGESDDQAGTSTLPPLRGTRV